ncbi:MAG: hypothetical protein HYY84_11070 [Deltaproteobacteria bacterium]|nr:hypothetical protein [Deltaproteobacteria bacterium]
MTRAERVEMRAPVLYYFHGGGGDAREWAESGLGRSAQAAMRSLGQHFHVVGVSLGPYRLYREDEEAMLFVRVMAEAEFALGDRWDGRRFIAGVSMGGFSALSIYLRHPVKFEAVAASSPTLFAFDPTMPGEMDAFVRRNRVAASHAGVLKSRFGGHFPSSATWRQFDPIRLVESAPTGARVYVSSGTNDRVGLFEGAAAFVRRARERGIKIEFDAQQGAGHGRVDPERVLRFFSAAQ